MGRMEEQSLGVTDDRRVMRVDASTGCPCLLALLCFLDPDANGVPPSTTLDAGSISSGPLFKSPASRTRISSSDSFPKAPHEFLIIIANASPLADSTSSVEITFASLGALSRTCCSS